MYSDLPEMAGVEPGVHKGRVPREGYQRGWGLQFGTLKPLVESEPLFKKAFEASTPLTSWISPEKRANIYLILTRFLPKLADKNVIEFGAFRGGTSVFMAVVLQEVAPSAKIFALDTFSGMPTTDKLVDAHSAGDFSETSLAALQEQIEVLKLTNLIPVKGLFQDTFPTLDANIKFGLAHLDADIYSAIKYAQDAVWPRMTEGGYVVYDDADVSSCIGATQAVEELIQERRAHSEQIWPHFVFRAGLTDHGRSTG